jgi:hypothetical protein
MTKVARSYLGQPCSCEFVVLESIYEVRSRGALNCRTSACLRCDCTIDGGYEELLGWHWSRLRHDRGWLWKPELLVRVSAYQMVALLPGAETHFRALAARAVSVMSADERLVGTSPERLRLPRFCVKLNLLLDPRPADVPAALPRSSLSIGFRANDETGSPTYRALDFTTRDGGQLIPDTGLAAYRDPGLARAFAPLDDEFESFWPDLLDREP